MRITGQLPGGFERLRRGCVSSFYDEPDGGTRLEVRQWLPEHLVSPTEEGWSEAFSKLDATFAGLSPGARA